MGKWDRLYYRHVCRNHMRHLLHLEDGEKYPDHVEKKRKYLEACVQQHQHLPPSIILVDGLLVNKA